MSNVRFSMTEAEYRSLDARMVGLCIACGEERECTEPDACGYPCPACGARKVYGAQELLLRGRITITDPQPRAKRQPAPQPGDPHYSGDFTNTRGACWTPGEPVPEGVTLASVTFGGGTPTLGRGLVPAVAAQHKRILKQLPTLKSLRETCKALRAARR